MVQLHCDNDVCDSWKQGADPDGMFITVNHPDGDTHHFCSLYCMTGRYARLGAVPA